jgi:hypothetical protein
LVFDLRLFTVPLVLVTTLGNSGIYFRPAAFRFSLATALPWR